MLEASGVLAKIKRNFRYLNDVWLFFRILSLVSMLPFCLRLFSLPTALEMLTPRRPRPIKIGGADKLPASAVKFTDVILGQNIWMFRRNCLRRSIVLYHLCRNVGLDVDICLGVRRKDQIAHKFDAKSDLDGHAWLVYQGRPVFERNALSIQSYTVTYCFPEQVRKKRNTFRNFT
jgi:hypothetical protein